MTIPSVDGTGFGGIHEVGLRHELECDDNGGYEFIEE